MLSKFPISVDIPGVSVCALFATGSGAGDRRCLGICRGVEGGGKVRLSAFISVFRNLRESRLGLAGNHTGTWSATSTQHPANSSEHLHIYL